MTSDQEIIERALNNVLKPSVRDGKVYLKQAVRQVTFGQVASVLSQAQSNSPSSSSSSSNMCWAWVTCL